MDKKEFSKLLEQCPGLVPFLPLLYVGWADSILSPGEVAIIRKKIEDMAWLSRQEKNIIQKWSKPSDPPSDELFSNWVDSIREGAKSIDNIHRQTLADLGLLMASASGNQLNQAQAEITKKGLEEVEAALGIGNLKDFRHLLSEEHKKSTGEADPTFDVKSMTLLLDGDYFAQKERVRHILADPIFKLEKIPLKEHYRRKVLEWCHLLAQQGWGALHLPIEYGGKGDMGAYTATFEILGYHDLSLAIKFGVQFGLFGGSVLSLGTAGHHQKILEKIGKMEITGCFAMTETAHGSNVKEIHTTAVYDQFTNEFVINTPFPHARKEYIGNALHGQMATVFAQLYTSNKHFGVHAFLVPLRTREGELLQGIFVEDCGYKLGLDGLDNGKIWFESVRIPRQNFLDQFAQVDENGNYSSPIESDDRRFFTMLGTLVGGRVAVPKAGLSAAKVALTIAIKYALVRRQFGPENEAETLLLNYPSHQRRLMPHLAKAYALSFALEHLNHRFIRKSEEDAREVETLAAGMKAYATWFTTETIQECREACGGKGYLFENRFASLKADTEIFTTFEGDNTVLMQLVAKGLLTEFKEEVNDLNVWGWIGFIAQQVTRSFSEIRYSDLITEDHLRSGEFQMDAFHYREKELLISVGRRLRKYTGRGLSGYDAFLLCQTHALHLAKAFVERMVCEAFNQKIEATENQDLRKILVQLRDLFALSQIEKDLSWYMEKGYIAPVKSKAIRKMVDKLCRALRHQALPLVNSFEIPAASLAAPIVL